ncbi:MAG TPA: M23 family metallopeptidase [Nitriliruptorales bacterium]|nr:M23 family metallopeptidase [Nitriliruptorales bacterium]
MLTATAHMSGGYTVRAGQTLEGIAAEAGTTVRELAMANGIHDPDRIFAGQVLTIPTDDGGPAAPSDGYHVVRSGESLSVIAGRYGVAVADLAAANGIVRPDRVMSGVRLRIAGGGPALTPAVAPATHRVSRGETLSGIAARYGIPVSELAAANGIDDPDSLLAGVVLQVRGGWRCPVAGPSSFVNDYGVSKGDGRFHEGVDLFAARGTPVVAPVAGRAEQVEGRRGGLQVWLYGDDGYLYISTHLDAFGAAGRVAPGTTVGSVGTSGNARATSPHLHFELHGPDGVLNPYPRLLEAC